ncbi:MAG: aminotransferase class I/II-fold pyridoxal phosphate-dependent enzyme, partial [Prevotella sp.]|nr:aminotransferase class I/II-fold pyridoxal phosphate-dependent enzyme [Prevotella sp.]
MNYDFDKIIDRRGTNCVKWDAKFPFSIETPLPTGEGSGEGLIPLWVADMDFEAAPAIKEALKKRVEHGVFGYATVQNSYYDAVIRWFERRHNWTIQREWIQYTTGVVPAVSAVIKALTMPGERVLILTPVYNCFFSNIRNNGCEVVESKLTVISSPNTQHPSPNTNEINWPDFERKCADEKTTVFLLCNPHNPAGRVWTHEELQRMNDICLRHGVRIVSDEIHCELV